MKQADTKAADARLVDAVAERLPRRAMMHGVTAGAAAALLASRPDAPGPPTRRPSRAIRAGSSCSSTT